MKPPADQNPAPVKISLNLAAVQRLIGGDTQAEIEVRQGIAAAFAKRWLGEAIDAEIKKHVEARVAQCMAAVEHHIQTTVDRAFAKGKWANGFIPQPTDRWRNASGVKAEDVACLVDNELGNVMRATVQQHLATMNLTARVEEYADRLLTRQIAENARMVVADRVKAALTSTETP